MVMSDTDVAIIIGCAQTHYDGTVKAASQLGGTFYGRRIRLRFNDNQDEVVTCDFADLDLAAKALEVSTHCAETLSTKKLRYNLRDKIMDILRRINKETRLKNPELLTKGI